MTTITDLRPALRAFLLGDGGVAGLVGTRIYPIKLPQGVLLASLVLTRISGLGDHTMQGPSGLARPRYQIDAWAQTLDEAASLADLTKAAIDGYSGPMSWTVGSTVTSINVQGVFFDSEREGFDDVAKLYFVSRDYFIWYGER